MIGTYERVLERLLKVLERLGNKAASKVPILVEGKKDVAALANLGIVGKTIQVKVGGKVLEDRLYMTREREVIVLVDFDDYGTELAKEIVNILQPSGVKPDLRFWREIRALVRKDVKDVEGLPSYLESLKKKVES